MDQERKTPIRIDSPTPSCYRHQHAMSRSSLCCFLLTAIDKTMGFQVGWKPIVGGKRCPRTSYLGRNTIAVVTRCPTGAEGRDDEGVLVRLGYSHQWLVGGDVHATFPVAAQRS